jgi:cell division protein FtsW
MRRNARVLLAVVLTLCLIGLVMLYSTGSVQAEAQQDVSPMFLVNRQAVAILIGFVILIAASRIPYGFWRVVAVPLLIAAVVLLALVWAPGIGKTVKGSSRWIEVAGARFQPSEFAKLAVVIWLAYWMERVHRTAFTFRRGLLAPLAGLGCVLLLIFAEPDFGATMLIALVGFGIMFAGGSNIIYLLASALLGGAVFVVAIMHNPNRMKRIMAFLNPEKYAEDAAFQLLNAIYAFVVGGSTGVGLGQSMQKRFYLPEAHTDFIFAIVGEEFGVVASLGVVFLFGLLLWHGIRISLRAPDHFGRLLALGLTLMLSLQAMINVAVVTGSMPTKGLPLPFISFGGSNMVISLLMIGILINIAGEAARREEGDDAPFIRDAVHQV